MDSLDLDGSITIWEDLTTLSEAWTRFKDLLQKVPHHGIDCWLQVQIFYDRINNALKKTIDYATEGRLRKLSAEAAWATIEKSKSIFGMTSNEMYQQLPEPSRQEDFEHIVMNFILDQEERVKQLEEYMKVIVSDFMQLSLEVIRRLKENIREEESRKRKFEKITKYPDVEVPEPLAGHKSLKESWALLEDLALYDNKSWNDRRDFTKPVKAIALPQDVLSTSDRHLIELENQVQRLMEAHLAPTQPTQVNKITTSCEIYSGPHDTQYCMEDPEQAFVELCILVYRRSGDARLSKFEAGFKQLQSDMTNKIDTVLKAITDRMAGALNRLAGSLPSNTVKNPKLSTYLILSARSYLTIDPQCLSHPSTSINAVKTCSKEASHSQTSLLQTGMKIGTQQTEEPKPTLEDEFQDLHLNIPVLEVLAHAPIYNAMLDNYVESLELGKNGPPFAQGEVSAKMEDPRLFTLPCRLGDSKPFDTLADLGSCVNIILLYLFKKLNIIL
ncbi:hypothetical protein Tco_1381682 [Tanacetum coccineum]